MQKDGVPLREHLNLVWESTGRKPEQLEQPECPDTLQHLWRYFMELSGGRSSNGFGVNPLGFCEIEAWDRLTGAGITPWEVQALKQLDGLYLAHVAKQQEKRGA